MASSIAIIPARGGSKRIPKKNIREFVGKPIIAYTIEAAVNSGIFDEVMVSTDSEEIAEIAKKYGANVPFYRSEKTAGDFASTDDVLMEVLDNYKANGKEFDYFACIYPTAPFIKAENLKEAMEVIKKAGTAMVTPFVAFSYPPQRSYIINEEGQAVFKYKEYITARSQDLEKWYHEAGTYYIFNTKKYKEMGGNIDHDISPVIIPEMEAQDIDTEEDWKIAELKYKLLNGML